MKRLTQLKNWQIYLVVFLLLIPVMILRDFTPSNELRYLQIADEALDNGSFFAFTNHGVAYADKPPLYLWIVMAGKALFGFHAMGFLALFSLLPAFVICEVMDRWTAPVLSRERRVAAIFTLLSCGLFAGQMVILRMDMLMTMWIVLALQSAWIIMTGPESQRARQSWLFGLYIFLGVFTKGPMGILIPLIAILVFGLVNRDFRSALRCWGWRTWTVALSLCIVWWGLTWAEGGNEYINNLLFHQTVDRAVDAFHHKRPFYYYLTSMTYTFMPWALLVIGVICVSAFGKKKYSRLEKYFLTIVLSTLVMLSCISSKLTVYLLPAYPFAVYLTWLLLPRFARSRWPKWLAAIPAIIVALLLPAIIVGWFVKPEFHSLMLSLFPAVVVLSVFAAWSAVVSLRKSLERGVSLLSFGIFAAAMFAGLGMDELNDYLGYRSLCERTQELSERTGIQDIKAIHVSRADNMDVYLGRQPEIYSKKDFDKLPDGSYILLTRLKDVPKIPARPHAVTDTVGKHVIVLYP